MGRAHGARFELERRGDPPTAYEGTITLPDRVIPIALRVGEGGEVRVEGDDPLDPELARLARAFVRTALRSEDPPRKITRWRG